MSGGARIQNQALDCGSVLLALPLLVAAVGVTSVAPGRSGHTSSSLNSKIGFENTAELPSEEMKPQLAQVLKAVIKCINFLSIFGK